MPPVLTRRLRAACPLDTTRPGTTSLRGEWLGESTRESSARIAPDKSPVTMESVFRLSIAREASLTRLWIGPDATDLTCRLASFASGLDLIGAGRGSG